MQVLKAVATLLLAATALDAISAAENTPTCKKEITDKYFENFSFDCSNILEDFKTCSDDCLASMKGLIQYSPNDCTSTVQGDPSMREQTEKKVKACEAARINAASRYTPQLSLGAEECSTTMTRAWSDKYGSSGTTYYDCSFNARVGQPCPDNCVKVIEEGIMAAPVCRLSVTTNLTSFEYEKRGLVSCLMVRGEDAKTNTVLQSTVNKFGASTVETTTTPTTATTPTPTSTTSSKLTTVAPSADLTTSTPAASSVPSLSTSLAAAVGSTLLAMGLML